MPPNSNTLFHTHAFVVTPSSSYSSVHTLKLQKPQVKRFVLLFAYPRRSRTFLEPSTSSSSFSPVRKTKEVAEEYVYPPENDDVLEDEEEREKRLGKACEVYVCNLPRSCDAAYLLYMFRPYGTILSIEVCRNAENNESKGCSYVTLGSIHSARNAVAALDGSDVGGCELQVRFSIEMNSRRRSFNKMNSSTKRISYYESPHKLYVGNLAKTVRPEQLRDLFCRFGNIVSARVLRDFKQGNSREFYGRTLIVKEGVERSED
ncbi:hypothetical protein JHK84_044236 [Glycine max]|nr:hypothetical protein JHK84_044236 [Glycine max]